MKVWALFPTFARSRKTPVMFRRVLGATRCFARVRVRRAEVLQVLESARIARVSFEVGTVDPRVIAASGLRAPQRQRCTCWLPFERIASTREKFFRRWATFAHAEETADLLLAGACADKARRRAA